MPFDLGQTSKVKYLFFFNISKSVRDIRFVCVIDIHETIYGLSFYAMTFDLGQSSKVKYAFSFSISKPKEDRSFVCFADTQETINMGFHLMPIPLTFAAMTFYLGQTSGLAMFKGVKYS